MPVKIEELQELSKDKKILVAAGGKLRPVQEIYHSDQMDYVILSAQEPPRKNQRFAAEEQQFLMGAVSLGIPIEIISKLLSRDEKSLQKKMKDLGVSYL